MTKYHKVEVKDNMKVTKEEQTPTEKPKIKPVINYKTKHHRTHSLSSTAFCCKLKVQ